MDESSESDINQKLLEYKYQELKITSQRMQKYYKKQLQELQESKTRALEELTGYYEAKLQKKVSQLLLSQEESRKNLREFEETKKQIETNRDQEIQDMKVNFEGRLREEEESSLRLKEQIDIMIQDVKMKFEWRLREEWENSLRLKEERDMIRKKFSSLQEECTMDIERMKVEKQNLQQRIKTLEEYIQDLESKVQERDKTLQEKENNICDLMIRNQKLKKCKHVEDYKIQDLKKEIELRDEELKEMKEKIQRMEGDFQLVHMQSSELEFQNSQLRQRLKAENQETLKERQKAGIVCSDAEIHQEYARQREHLQCGITAQQKQLNHERETHREGSVWVMQENVTLIKETNELRQELKVSRSNVQDLEAALHRSKKKHPILSADSKVSVSAGPKSSAVLRLNREKETPKITKLPQIENKGLMQSQKLPAGSVPSRVSAVLRLNREKETAKITKLPQIENKVLMQSQKLPAGSVASRVGKLPAVRMPS